MYKSYYFIILYYFNIFFSRVIYRNIYTDRRENYHVDIYMYTHTHTHTYIYAVSI